MNFKLFGLFVLMFAATIIQAQELDRAMKQYEMGFYDLAIGNFEALQAEGLLEADMLEAMAISYARVNKPQQASLTYEKLAQVKELDRTTYVDWLAQAYEAEDHTQVRTIKQLVEGKYSDDVMLLELDQSPITNNARYQVNEAAFQLDATAFAVTERANQTVFVYEGLELITSAKQKGNPSVLAVYDFEQNRIQQLRPQQSDFWYDGPTQFASASNNVVFSKNRYSKNESPKMGNPNSGSIYYGTYTAAGDFQDIISLPCNELGVSNIYPTISADGMRVYFASNREGGYGGYDIYYTERIGEGWSTPKNMGSEVNSKRDEISPLVTEEQLFFASNGKAGYGGFDLFTYAWNTELTYNLGKDINSASDEYALFTSDNGATGFFNSNRAGKAGIDRIYAFSQVNTPEFEALAVNLTTQDASASDLNNDSKRVYDRIVSTETEEVVTNTTSSNAPVRKETKRKSATVVLMAEAPKAPTAATVVTEEVRIELEDEDNGRTIYSVQVAALSEDNPSSQKIMRDLEQVGDVFRVFENKIVKIRVGQFDKESSARHALIRIKNRGYKDAFIVTENLYRNETIPISTPKHASTTSQPTYRAPAATSTTTTSSSTAAYPASKPVSSTQTKAPTYETQTTGTWIESSPNDDLNKEVVVETVNKTEAIKPVDKSNYTKSKAAFANIDPDRLKDIPFYRIKLGAYTDLEQVDEESLKKYGTLYYEKMDEWTIVFVGDYLQLEDAEAIRMACQKSGFKAAKIYGLRDGELLKIE